ncbi:MAG: right-handed parallel beta-helix repeat-containing protein [Planctomycetia bacterium]|nr:right-handed parallel beta-helix repeat-containing protein [Planctomycetia bacterium]
MKKILFLPCLCFCVAVSLFAQGPSQSFPVNQVLDDGKARGPVPYLPTGKFTVAFRFCPLGQGVKTFSGRGMLVSVASGYDNGFRVHFGNTDHRIAFELGDAQLGHSVGLSTQTAATLGVWHDVVCSYDGQTMKIYLDGEESASREASVKVDTKNAPLMVGYVDYGIGSTKMKFGVLDYLPRACTEKEVKARYAQHPKAEREKISLLRTYGVPENVVNLDLPTKKLRMISKIEGISETLLRSVQDATWKQYLAEGTPAKAAPLVLAKAKKLLDAEIPQEEKLADQNVRMSELWETLEALDQLGDVKKCKETAGKLREKFAADVAYLAQIHALDTSMRQRVAGIEKNARAHFKTVCRTAKNPDARKLYLAPDGNDENDGTKEKPLASLAAALEKALELQREGTSVIVEVADGEYFVTQTFVVKNAVLPETDATILVRAAKGAQPVFNGGVTLRDFTPVSDAEIRNRFQPEVRDKILVCDLKQAGVPELGKRLARGYGCNNEHTPWGDLFVDGKAQTLARWPNADEPELSIGEVVSEPGVAEPDTFRYDFDRPDRWAESDDLLAYGLWQYEWASRTVPVKKIDRKARTIQVDFRNLKNRFTYHFLNVMEELDRPGEYYIDRVQRRLYLIPEGDLRHAQVEYPVFRQRFFDAERVKNLVFDGLTFKNSQLGGFHFTHCENVYLKNCELAQLGSSGVAFVGGRYNGLCDSEIRNVGSCGVRMYGGNRDTLEPCYYLLHNCLIHDFSRIDRAYAPAAHAIGVGMCITNNLMFDSPHHAMRVEGNDQLVARNEVHSVVYDFSDQSGIDIYCDPTYRGIVIDRNFWHHIGSSFALCGQAGIRLDDSISGVVMTENVFYRSSGGIFGGIQIHGGKDNIVARNLFAECTLGVSFTPWAEDRYLKFVFERFPKHIEPYQKLGVYPFLDTLDQFPNRNYLYDNETVNGRRFVRSLNRGNLFKNNVTRTVKTGPASDTPQELRRWVETACNRNLADVGIQKSVHFPQGQSGIPHTVSPNYSSVHVINRIKRK